MSTFRLYDYDCPTVSSEEQKKVEASVALKFSEQTAGKLLVDEHLKFLMKGLKNLSSGYECLDASRPWMCYWILHSIDLLGAMSQIKSSQRKSIAEFLFRCWDQQTGGFGGGPGQQAHLATTYAAVNAFSVLGPEYADSYIDRPKLLKFLLLVKMTDGSFTMHQGGESDVRGAYCALSCATLLNIVTPELIASTVDYLKQCQTYEGGFTSEPGGEAHGGYTFCGSAALLILDKLNEINVHSLLKYSARRQMAFEGGFHGRTNKLVDGCYSFWQAAVVSMLSPNTPLFDTNALRKYILLCCQNPKGGLLDKPGKSPDFYHTCYCLSGLSLTKFGGLQPVDVRFNVTVDKAVAMISHFKSK